MQERRVDNALSHSASHDVAAVAVEAAARMLGLAWACARVQFAQVARRRCLLLASAQHTSHTSRALNSVGRAVDSTSNQVKATRGLALLLPREHARALSTDGSPPPPRRSPRHQRGGVAPRPPFRVRTHAREHISRPIPNHLYANEVEPCWRANLPRKSTPSTPCPPHTPIIHTQPVATAPSLTVCVRALEGVRTCRTIPTTVCLHFPTSYLPLSFAFPLPSSPSLRPFSHPHSFNPHKAFDLAAQLLK
ncbi:unnamed protein product [Mesocestoides corti]|uniref:Uncharacterized protein n=1 Tax=Mesocestoides corti TaxID=53468 RepID=A0A0R3UDX6_MESCO|nr:unnamed protein product [Mesocestoides corti]